jgi:hypothetical protein
MNHPKFDPSLYLLVGMSPNRLIFGEESKENIKPQLFLQRIK